MLAPGAKTHLVQRPPLFVGIAGLEKLELAPGRQEHRGQHVTNIPRIRATCQRKSSQLAGCATRVTYDMTGPGCRRWQMQSRERARAAKFSAPMPPAEYVRCRGQPAIAAPPPTQALAEPDAACGERPGLHALPEDAPARRARLPGGSRVMLVGQAPGRREPVVGRPFAWTAGGRCFHGFCRAAASPRNASDGWCT